MIGGDEITVAVKDAGIDARIGEDNMQTNDRLAAKGLAGEVLAAKGLAGEVLAAKGLAGNEGAANAASEIAAIGQTKSYSLAGASLVPGEYVLNRESGGLLHISDKATGAIIGSLNIANALSSMDNCRQYGNVDIRAYAAFDDGKPRFPSQGYESPLDLLHVCVRSSVEESHGTGSHKLMDYTRNAETVLVFNKTLDHFVEDAKMYCPAFRQGMANESVFGRKVDYLLRPER